MGSRERVTQHMIGQHGRQNDTRVGHECFLMSLTELLKGDHQGCFTSRTYFIINHLTVADVAVGSVAMGMAITNLLILNSSQYSGEFRKWVSIRGKQSCIPGYSGANRLNLRVVGRCPASLHGRPPGRLPSSGRTRR